MAAPLFDHDIDDAFEDVIGDAGASKTRFTAARQSLVKNVPNLLAHPPREAVPVFRLPYDKGDLAEIEAIASTIKDHFSTLVVVGMGGSSLSGETLAPLATNALAVHFLDNIDPETMESLMAGLPWQDTCFLIISKSGGTVETLAHLAILLREVGRRVANPAAHFMVLTMTDGNALHSIALHYNIRVIAHEPALGGRFSILSPVGLIPAASMGIDIRALRAGARDVMEAHRKSDIMSASAVEGAALVAALMEKRLRIHVFMHYGDSLTGLTKWFRQCWGESLGKCEQTPTPACSRGATDQHSQLQLYLDGTKDKLFTVLQRSWARTGPAIDFPMPDPRLQFLQGRTLGDLMEAEQRATVVTLAKRGCPVRGIRIDAFNGETLGALLMHFTLEVIFTAHLLGVNAFDQPAVEEGKKLALQFLSQQK